MTIVFLDNKCILSYVLHSLDDLQTYITDTNTFVVYLDDCCQASCQKQKAALLSSCVFIIICTQTRSQGIYNSKGLIRYLVFQNENRSSALQPFCYINLVWSFVNVFVQNRSGFKCPGLLVFFERIYFQHLLSTQFQFT